MIKRILLASGVSAVLLAQLVLSPPAFAQKAPTPEPASPAVTKQVKSSVEAWLKGRFKVDAVSKTVMPGLVEVRIGKDILYAHENGQFALVEGQLIELKSGSNLTAARMEVLQAVDVSKLPLDLAMKTVQGDGGKGARTIVVFEDPYCSFCRKYRAVLMSMDNVTIYTYFYPILRAESTTLSKNAWCANDREAALEGWMMGGQGARRGTRKLRLPQGQDSRAGQRVGCAGHPHHLCEQWQAPAGCLGQRGA